MFTSRKSSVLAYDSCLVLLIASRTDIHACLFWSSFFYIYNNSTRTGQSTSITQNTKPLCAYTTYKLSYTSKLTITGGEYMGVTCTVRISLGGLQLVFIGPPNGDPPPFDRQTRETTFTTTGSPPGNLFKVELSCGAPAGEYVIDDISIVGV